MKWWEIVGLALTGGTVVSIINLIGERLKRKDAINDRRYDAAAQIEELRNETAEQFTLVDNRIKTVETKLDTVAISMDAVRLSTKAQAYDRIRHLGMQHIKNGYITEDELRNLTDMHEAYHRLGGNGFLDKVMTEVYKLRIKVD